MRGCGMWHWFNSNKFVTSVALVEVTYSISTILVDALPDFAYPCCEPNNITNASILTIALLRRWLKDKK